jgi:hypothetical protein
MRKNRYRILYFPRNRVGVKNDLLNAEENAAGILEKLEGIKKLDESLSRTKRIVRDLLFCNKFDYFCTFTFNGCKVDRFNYKDCQKKITNLFMNYKSRYSCSFRYVIVPEFHKDGAIHFHGMISGINPDYLVVPEMIWKRDRPTGKLEMVPNTRKYVDWPYYSKKLGFFSCSRVKNHTACALYVSKYITKDLLDLPVGVRAVMASKNLERPDLAFDEDNIGMIGEADWKSQFVWISDTNDHMGLVPPWYGECCSDLHDLPELDEAALRDEAFFPRLTGSQLKLGVC